MRSNSEVIGKYSTYHMKNLFRSFLLVTVLLGAGTASLHAAEPAVTHPKPMVAVLRADWCPTCKKLEQGMGPLVGKYSGRLDFVVLDVTSDEAKGKSAARARELGLGDFFARNLDQGTPVIAIISRSGKEVFHQVGSDDLALYDKAFAKAATTNPLARCYHWMTGS